MIPADLSVLYVEDDPMSREVMQVLLVDSLGLQQVTIFENSQNFWPRLLSLDPRPQLILLDIHVHPLTGFQMLELLRHNPEFAQVPVVAMTASVMNEEVQLLRQAGFNGVFPKPVDIDLFPANLARILQGESIWQIVS
jgi:CheY-like chemotaxis protein